MAFKDDIQTIAKTKEIEEKVNKALKTAEEAKKQNIPVTRATAAQLNTGANVNQSGNNASGSTTIVIGQDGSVTEAPLAPPTQPQQANTQTTTSTSTGVNSDKQLIEQKGSISRLPANAGDQSSNGMVTVGGGAPTRQDAVNQANPTGTNSTIATDVQTIIDADVALGKTPQAIRDDVRFYMAKKQQLEGKTPDNAYEVSDIDTGEAGLTPTQGNLSTNLNIIDDSNLAVPRINAITGLDPDNSDMAVRVAVNGASLLPSIDEALDSDQNPWTDYTQGPVVKSYTAGLVWHLIAGSTNIWSQTWQGLRSQREAYDGTQCYGISGGLVSSTSPTAGTSSIRFGAPGHSVGDSAASVGGTTYNFLAYTAATPVSLGQYGQQDCGLDGGDSVTCALPEPHESMYPPIGLYQFALTSTGLTTNSFDGETPLEYRQEGISKIRLLSATTNFVYGIELAAQGGFMLYNETVPKDIKIFGADRTLKEIVPIDLYKFYKPQ